MTGAWSDDRRLVIGLAIAIAAGMVLRLLLLPAPGLADDIDQFVLWVHGIAIGGLPNAYDQNLSFPPVMAYIWGLLAALDPAFRTATDSSDIAVRVVMKLPATLADFGLAGLTGLTVSALRFGPSWAVAASAAVLLHPAVLYVGAWWGQYESIYLLSALAATLLAIRGRNGWAAAAIAVSLMTKPQALPMLVPMAAWFWATGGWRELLRTALVGAAVVIVVWLPFVAAGGPLHYLDNLATYQGAVFAILSLRAWNVWWLVQELAGGGQFVADNTPFLGPLTLRHVGFAITGLLEIVVATAVIRSPRPATLVLAMAVSVLVAFTFLTTMHERYAFGALVFLGLLVAEPRIRALALAFGTVFTLNLLAAVSPLQDTGAILPVSGLLGIVASLAMIVLTVDALLWLSRDARAGPDPAPA